MSSIHSPRHSLPGGLTRRLSAMSAMLIGIMCVAAPALAHGDHDARPLLRNAEAGPYGVSLWQVYPDVGSSVVPHLIVVLDGTPSDGATVVSVTVGETSVEVVPSMTTERAWETTVGVEPGDLVEVRVTDDDGSWALDTVTIPPPLTSVLPMRALIMISIFLATGVAWWAAGRTAQAWRRPLQPRSQG